MVQTGLAGLAQADVAGQSDQQVHDEVVVLLRCANQLHAVLAERIASFDLRGLSKGDAVRTTLSWLRVFSRMSDTAASGWLARARLLRELPAVSAAAKEGLVSAEHLTPIRRLAKEVGIAAVREFDEALATVARAADPKHVAVTCARIHAHLDPDGGPPDPMADFERRELSLRPVGSMLHIRGRLDAEGGAALTAAIDALMRPPSPGDERTAPQRRADALVDLARGSIGSGQLPTIGGLAPTVGVLVTPHDLVGAPSDSSDEPSTHDRSDAVDPGQCDADPLARHGVPTLPQMPWLSWIGEIPAETARRLACDAVVWRIVMDPGRGLPLDVGRAHRVVPHWMRRALHARDRTCRWPGCDVPAVWCDAHHEIPWSRGGPTAIRNLISLCRYHHVLTHEGEWRLTLDHATGEVWVRRPDGRPYELGPSLPWTGTSRRGSATSRHPGVPAADTATASEGPTAPPETPQRSEATSRSRRDASAALRSHGRPASRLDMTSKPGAAPKPDTAPPREATGPPWPDAA